MIDFAALTDAERRAIDRIIEDVACDVDDISINEALICRFCYREVEAEDHTAGHNDACHFITLRRLFELPVGPAAV